MPDPIDPVHARIMTSVLKLHPQVNEVVNVVHAVASKAKFPINSFHDLAEALPGAALEFGGRKFTLAELQQQIPSYYFPIASENDLIAKVADLGKRIPTASPVAAEIDAIQPKLIAATGARPSHPPPALTVEQLHAKAGFTARPAPGTGGIHE